MTKHARIADKGAQPIGDVMARSLKPDELKPSKKMIANAIEHTDGRWMGQWSVPGMIPDFVRFPDSKEVKLYDSEKSARFAAMATAINVFNTPRKRVFDQHREVRTRGGRPAKMSGRDLSDVMSRLDLSPGDLAFILDKPINRILGWMDGAGDKADIPHEVRLLMAIFDKYDDAVDLAEGVTNDAIDEREDAG